MAITNKKVSENITLVEAVRSNIAARYGVLNLPDTEQFRNMQVLAEKVFQPTRAGLGNKPIYISNFFRSPKLNELIPGAAKRSQHLEGKAMDIDNDGLGKPTNADIFYYIKDNLEFDQLIWEFGTNESPAWVHVSYNEGNNRQQILEAYRDTEINKTKYKSFEDKREL